MSSINDPLEIYDIRLQAETELKEKNYDPDDYSWMTSKQVNVIIKELRVHEIELKMQNDELRRIQQDLEDVHNRYAQLYHFSPIGYFTLGKTGVIEDVNFTGCDMLGLEIRTVKSTYFTHYIVRDDQDIFYKHRQLVLESEKPCSCILRLKRPGGKQFYAQIVSQAEMDELGNVQFIRLTASDIIDQQKQSGDGILKYLVNSMKDAIYVIDNETGRFIDMNENACLDLQYTRSDLLNKGINDVDTHCQWERLASEIKTNGFLLVESNHTRSDGMVFPVEVNYSQANHSDANYIVAVARNVALRKSKSDS